MRPARCADCGSPSDLRPLRLLTDPSARWLCTDTDACVRRTLQAAYWFARQVVTACPTDTNSD